MCLWCLGRRDSPAIAARLVGYFNRPAREPGVLPELTDREREILAVMMRGLTNGEIASTLALTPKTVRNYASNVLAKLQVHDREQAVQRARTAGFDPGTTSCRRSACATDALRHPDGPDRT
jgi:DNA-binding NarL/FixJ family response regulator